MDDGSPRIFGFLIFWVLMIASLILSFCDYDVLHPAKVIGITNFIDMLGFHRDTDVGDAWQMMAYSGKLVEYNLYFGYWRSIIHDYRIGYRHAVEYKS